jgi:chromosome segregation ATPase
MNKTTKYLFQTAVALSLGIGAVEIVVAQTAPKWQEPLTAAPAKPDPLQSQVDALKAQVAQLQQQLQQAGAIEQSLQKQRNDAEDQVALARAQIAILQQTQGTPKP